MNTIWSELCVVFVSTPRSIENKAFEHFDTQEACQIPTNSTQNLAPEDFGVLNQNLKPQIWKSFTQT